MNESLNIAASGMAAVQRMLDASTHNTVNSATPGYQKHQTVLKSFGAFLNQAGSREGLIGAEEVLLFAQGDLRESDAPYSFALSGEGLMTLKGPDGGYYYTRNGDFTLNSDGELVSRAGYRVMAEGDAPIVIDPVAGPITVDSKGTIFQGGAEVGVLQVSEFPKNERDQLVAVAETIYQARDGYRAPPAEDTSVHFGFLEFPADGGMKGMVDMLVASKNYDAMQRAIRSIDQLNENMIRQVQ